MGNRKLGVALSGGGARGFAHIGLLHVLEQFDIHIDFISGTSMGGLIAALYSNGFSAAQLEEEALKFSNFRELIKLVEIVPPRRGLIDHKRIQQYLSQLLGDNRSFDTCTIPLGLCSVDLMTANEVHFTTGDLIPAVMGTISFPGIFPPVDYNGFRLIDGGILNNVPVNIVRNLGAEMVLAMNVELDWTFNTSGINLNQKLNWPLPASEAFRDFYNSCLLMISKITEFNLQQSNPDILINPRIPLDISEFFGFNRVDEIIELGKLAAYNAIPEILASLSES